MKIKSLRKSFQRENKVLEDLSLSYFPPHKQNIPSIQDKFQQIFVYKTILPRITDINDQHKLSFSCKTSHQLALIFTSRFINPLNNEFDNNRFHCLNLAQLLFSVDTYMCRRCGVLHVKYFGALQSIIVRLAASQIPVNESD